MPIRNLPLALAVLAAGLLLLATVARAADDATTLVDPRGDGPIPPMYDGDQEVMHNLDLGAPGGMYESNYTQANNCPACAAFALAIRRLNWDTPPREGARDRRAGLVHDQRVSEIAFDAFGAVVHHYVYVPSRQRYAPLVYARLAPGLLTAAELALADKHVEMHGDQQLMDFIHFRLAEEAGDEAESMAGRDLLKGRLPTDFSWPPGTGDCDAKSGPECLDRLSTLVILKDRAADLEERVRFAKAVCTRACGKRDVRTAIPLEHYDMGVPSILQQYEAVKREAQEKEEAAELAREAARFPPEDRKTAKEEAEAAEVVESEHQTVFDKSVHGRHDPSGAAPADGTERETADLATHEESRRMKRDATGAVSAEDEGEF